MLIWAYPRIDWHKSSKTTEMYAHVRNKEIRRIKSPLDSLFEKKSRGIVKGCEDRKSKR
jgi:hypothetical protein